MGQELLPINLEPTLVDLLDTGVQRLEDRPTWKVRNLLKWHEERGRG